LSCLFHHLGIKVNTTSPPIASFSKKGDFRFPFSKLVSNSSLDFPFSAPDSQLFFDCAVKVDPVVDKSTFEVEMTSQKSFLGRVSLRFAY
jgi:hypothetical protein